MKILLINPPFQRFKKIKNAFFPLGLGYLSSSLRKNGFTCAIYNAEIPQEKTAESIDNKSLLSSHYNYINALKDDRHIIWEEIRQTLNYYNPDIVGITSMTPNYGSALKISRIAKERNKDCKVIFGGPHPTIDTESVISEETIDFVISGEGEETIVELCNAIAKRADTQDFLNIKGLSYKKKDTIFYNKPRDLIRNLDGLVFPDKDCVLYRDSYPLSAFGSLTASRGCSFECGYCSAHRIWGRRVRFRNIHNVIDEIQALRNSYHIHEFYFMDDNFTFDRSYVIDLCNAIINHKINISWTCITRANLLDDALVKTMKKAGCFYIYIGIESGSNRILELINKKITLEQIKDCALILRKNRLSWGAFFMLGFPGETKDDIEKTKRCIEELSPTSIEFSIFTPYPGTALYDLCKNRRLIFKELDWSRFSHQSPENYFNDTLNKEEFDSYIASFSEFVDKYNRSMRSLLRKTLNRGSFWGTHPQLFLKKGILYFKKIAPLYKNHTVSRTGGTGRIQHNA